MVAFVLFHLKKNRPNLNKTAPLAVSGEPIQTHVGKQKGRNDDDG